MIITACIVYIWDYSGFVQECADYFMELITKGKIKHVTLRKPWGCSLCMTTWITLIVLLKYEWILAPMCLVYGWSTQYVLAIFNLIDNAMIKVLSALESLINNE